MDSNERARRRADVERLKRKREGYFGRAGQLGGYAPPMNPRELGMVAATPKPCSCAMCGNQRDWHGPTIQERRWGYVSDTE